MDAKFRGEEALRASGVDYCIVRPGGLDHGLKAGGPEDHVLIVPRDGESPPGGRSVWRKDVAAVVVAALDDPAASRTTIEVVARPATEKDSAFEDRALFEGIQP